MWKNSTIAAQSNRDRGAIEPRSLLLHSGITSTRLDGVRRVTRTSIMARSRRDRGMIVVHFEGQIETILPQIRELRHCTRESLPRRRNQRSQPSPSSTISSPISSLKSHVLFLCSSNFDRLVKKLSEFRGRS